MDEKMAVIGEDGWTALDTPPDSDRIIQLAWEDGSYGQSTLGFYDMKAEIPQSGVHYWWILTPMRPINAETISAWREKP